jgi:hypothetical protein
MSGDDLPPNAPPDDPDRAAILARRQRFLAIALSGLASGIACAPQVCLKVATTRDPNQPPSNPPAESPSTPPEPIPDDVTPPVEPSPEPTPPTYTPPPPRAEPRPCLKVVKPRDP